MFVGGDGVVVVVVIVMLSIKIDKHRHIDNNDNEDRCYTKYIHTYGKYACVYTYVHM